MILKTLTLKVKLIIIAVVIVVLGVLSATIAIQSHRISSLTRDLSYANANEKALMLINDSNKNQIRSLQFTVEQLDFFNDSIMKKLDAARKELKVKDKDLKELQYLKTVATKTDTVKLLDTIFVDNFCLDTTIQDEWHKTSLELCYPNTIIVSPEFTSEKTIVTHLKKETVNPPKKCWLARLFQKKHKVIIVDIKEENPYITTKEYRHVEIIGK